MKLDKEYYDDLMLAMKENYELIIDSSCGIEKTANTILEYVSNNAGNL